MSKGDKIPRFRAWAIACEIIERLKPVCQRVEIAGSLRRELPMVGDIDLLCIPHTQADLFGSISYLWGDIPDRLEHLYHKNKGGDHYQQYQLQGCTLEVYACTPEQWGVMMALRTGGRVFSRKLVMPKTFGGFLPEGFYVEGGRLWQGTSFVSTPEEANFFHAIGLEYIQPTHRN